MMKKKKKYTIAMLWLWGSDIALMATAFFLAYAIRFSDWFPTPLGIPAFKYYLNTIPFCVAVYFFVLRFYGLYRFGKHISLLSQFFMIVKSVFMGSLFLMAGSFVYRDFTYSRTMLILAAVMLIVMLFVNRVFFYWLVSKAAKIIGMQRKILLIGRGTAIRNLIDGLIKNRKSYYAIAGLLTEDKENVGTHINDVKITGTIEDFETILKIEDIDEVILGENSFTRKEILQLVLKAEENLVEFKMISDLLGLMTNKLDIESVNGVSLLGVKETPLNRPLNRALKRLLDLTVSISALIFFLPVLVLIALLVKLSDGGPIFFKQERVGEGGKLFNIYKFRSMKVNAEEESGPQFATDEDPRKTRLGSFLRKSNLDELPQILNVIIGNMSVVGPRPERPVFVDQLKTDIPRYMARHKVLTGITGWAQVNGLRGGPPSEERIKYDLYYIENWSIWMDIKIILMTPFSFKGAK